MQFALSTILPILLSTTTLASPLFTVDLPAPTNSTSLAARDQNIGKVSGLQIRFYGGPDCTSTVSLWTGVVYNTQIYGVANSYSLSRDLIDNELLDFSWGNGLQKQDFAMTDAVADSSGQYPGPGYIEGGFTVPSQCNNFIGHAPEMAHHLSPAGKKLCYTVKRTFNCARLWMRS